MSLCTTSRSNVCNRIGSNDVIIYIGREWGNQEPAALIHWAQPLAKGREVMSIRDVVMRAMAVSAAGLPVLMSGCISTSGEVISGEVEGARLSDNFVVYAPFDNERDWGPSYLVDAPDRHFGDEVRIDDTRTIPRVTGTGPTDPSNPPQAQTLP